MVKRYIDLIGSKVGRLTVTGLAIGHNQKSRAKHWVCNCECGGQAIVRSDGLRSGRTKSCGCLSSETAKNVHSTHMMTGAPEYHAWINMRRRCYDTKSRDYKNYGGRGITVFESWRNSFEEFFEHVGKRPSVGFELDRIDNDRGYYPGNVRWVTREVNQSNRRKIKIWIIEGREFERLEDAASFYGVCARTISNWCNGGKDGCSLRGI